MSAERQRGSGSPKTGEQEGLDDGEDGAEMVALGVVARPHGVRGELRVHSYNPDSTLLFEVDRVWLKPATGRGRKADIEAVRPGPKGAVLVSLTHVLDREEAEALRGTELCVPRDTLPAPEDGEWYHVDLIGLCAVLEDGSEVGRVVGVIPYPTVDCLKVKTGAREVEVPMVDGWMGDVDLTSGTVVVSDPSSLPDSRAKRRRPR